MASRGRAGVAFLSADSFFEGLAAVAVRVRTHSELGGRVVGGIWWRAVYLPGEGLSPCSFW